MYRWKSGSVHGIDAEVAGKALEEIVSRHGVLTPRLVVEESRPPSAPLHDEFEWDDSVAAELYREHQARYIIRSVVVAVPEREETYVRAFVSVVPNPPEPQAAAADASGQSESLPCEQTVPVLASEEVSGERPAPVYVRTMDALADPLLRRQVLERALKELEAWQRRYSELEELAQLFQAVQAVRQQVLQIAA